MLNSSTSARRSVFVVLAAIALMAVLARPMCDLWVAHLGTGATAAHAATPNVMASFSYDGNSAEQCCASISDPHHIVPFEAVSGATKFPQGLGPATFVAVLTATAIVARQLHWLRAPPRSLQSFYLRSARILR